jgi:tetratricopeptide (TPR) repeat protein
MSAFLNKTKKSFLSDKKILSISGAFFSIFLFFTLNSGASPSGDRFFAYERFFINEAAISGREDQGLIRRDLDAFIKTFNQGLYYFSGGDTSEAEKSFQKARRLWPEYYATDFLLARVYEQTGEYSIAARYYKSYLDKLYKLRSGVYRLTGPLMISFNSGGIESYNKAYGYIKERLEEYGIDIDKVVPAFNPPGAFLFLIISLPGIAVIIFIYHKTAAFWRKRKRIENIPEGFWMCPECGTYNPLLRNECEQCGHKKENSGH